MKRRTVRRWLGEGLLLAALAALAFAHGQTERAVAAAATLLQDGRPQEALRRMGRVAEHDAIGAYVRGSAHLALGAPAQALDPLAVAAASGEPELGRRAWHNLSVAHLLLAGDGRGDDGRQHARAAAAAAMESLRLDPGSPGTRWNLALAWRILDEDDGGAAAGDGTSAGQGPGGPSPDQGESPAGMTAAEATLVLDALRSAEGSAAVRGIVGGQGGGAMSSPSRRGPPW